MSPKQSLIKLCQERGMHVIVNRNGACIESVELWAGPGTALDGEGQGHCYVERDWRGALEMARLAIKNGGPHVCPLDCECRDDPIFEPYGCRLIEPNVWES